MRFLRRLTRQQWQAVALLVVCVLVSGAALRFQADAPRTQIVNAKMGQDLTLGPTQHIKVESVESATTVILNDDTYGRTEQVFLVVSFTFTTSKKVSALVDTRLVVDDIAYMPQERAFPMPQSGYTITHKAIFEVPRDHLEGASIHFVDTGLVRSFERELAVDLGITKQRAQQLLDEARQKAVRVERTSEVPQ